MDTRPASPRSQALVTMLRDCHDASISSLHFLPGQPLLLSSAGDNALKVWIFDQADGTARLLRSRAGHR
jgi:U3 small nucleolar RNA-associated protein 21